MLDAWHLHRLAAFDARLVFEFEHGFHRGAVEGGAGLGFEDHGVAYGAGFGDGEFEQHPAFETAPCGGVGVDRGDFDDRQVFAVARGQAEAVLQGDVVGDVHGADVDGVGVGVLVVVLLRLRGVGRGLRLLRLFGLLLVDVEVLIFLDPDKINDPAAGAFGHGFAPGRHQGGHQPVQQKGDDQGDRGTAH